MDLVLQLLIALTSQIGPISDLIAKMRAENRTTLTPAEWAVLDSAWEAAHADALVALAAAKAAGK